MKYHVYILVSERRKNWSYVGSTSNIIQRLKDHMGGKTKSTKAYRPLRLIYQEEFDTKQQARDRELFLKSGFGREEKQTILKYSGIV
ncbi:GIY-YIG nuclease family protein [Candidatus Kuenenbacteria bacterium]|nr:GIY-YIG nuclease family protein [Candidatus Kuenenbacteria bacterium]